MDRFIQYVLTEMREISRFPFVFGSALIVCVGLLVAGIWWAMDWRYSGIITNRDGIISNRDSEISLLKTQLDAYKDAFKNNIPLSSHPNNYGDVIKRLVELVNEAEQIQQTFLEKNDAALIKNQTNDWYQKVNNFLNEKLDPSFSSAFRNSPNALVMPLNHSMEGGGYWQILEGKKAALINIVSELRQKR